MKLKAQINYHTVGVNDKYYKELLMEIVNEIYTKIGDED